jgi:hypothetical protein
VTCEAYVSVSAPSEVCVGTSFSADVSVTEVSDLDTAYFVLYFDPVVLQATGVRAGDLTASATPIFNIDNANGKVTVVVNIPGLTGVSGEGTIAEIDFDAIGCDPNFSDLTLSDVLLGDIDAEEIPSLVDVPTIVVNVTCCAVEVSISAPSEVASGSFIADVSVTQVTDLDTAFFVLSFDATVLQATNVTSGEVTAAAAPTFKLDNANGKVIVVVNIPGLTGVSGAGIIAQVEFSAISCDTGSDLSLSNVLLGDINAQEIESTIGDSVYVSITTLFGDASGNCQITMLDAALILQWIVGLINSFPGFPNIIGPDFPQQLDVSNDGTLSAYDASLVAQRVVGLIDVFPIEEGTIAAPAIASKRYNLTMENIPEITDNQVIVPIKVSDVSAGTVSLAYDDAILKVVNVSAVNLSDDNWAYKVVDGHITIAFACPEPVSGNSVNIEFQTIKTESIPATNAIRQNYPNPFNPETWIPYQLSRSSDVTIHIHNIHGQLVRTLDLGHKFAGLYFSKDKAAYWNGRNKVGERVASGIYFYTIQAGKYTATRRMLILK